MAAGKSDATAVLDTSILKRDKTQCSCYRAGGKSLMPACPGAYYPPCDSTCQIDYGIKAA